MITINSWARASTKPGQMSMLERREPLGALAMGLERRRRSAPGLFGEGGDRTGDNADVAAQVLNALLPALDDVLTETRDIGLDVAEMAAQHVVVPKGALGDIGKPGQSGIQLQLVLGEPDHQDLTGFHLLAECAETIGQAGECRVGGDSALLTPRENTLEVVQ